MAHDESPAQDEWGTCPAGKSSSFSAFRCRAAPADSNATALAECSMDTCKAAKARTQALAPPRLDASKKSRWNHRSCERFLDDEKEATHAITGTNCVVGDGDLGQLQGRFRSTDH
jgi:hypothetical protein